MASPACHPARRGQSAIVFRARRQLGRIAKPGHIHRRAPVQGRAVAQLAGLIPAPALHPALDGQRAGVRGAGGQRGDSASQSGHIHRLEPVICRAVAQLAVFVVPPALHSAAVGQTRRCAKAPPRPPSPPGQAGHVHRAVARGPAAVSELAVPVVAPAFHAAGGCQQAGMGTPGGDRGNPQGGRSRRREGGSDACGRDIPADGGLQSGLHRSAGFCRPPCRRPAGRLRWIPNTPPGRRSSPRRYAPSPEPRPPRRPPG